MQASPASVQWPKIIWVRRLVRFRRQVRSAQDALSQVINAMPEVDVVVMWNFIPGIVLETCVDAGHHK